MLHSSVEFGEYCCLLLHCVVAGFAVNGRIMGIVLSGDGYTDWGNQAMAAKMCSFFRSLPEAMDTGKSTSNKNFTSQYVGWNWLEKNGMGVKRRDRPKVHLFSHS